jgi:hypothetical protein
MKRSASRPSLFQRQQRVPVEQTREVEDDLIARDGALGRKLGRYRGDGIVRRGDEHQLGP